MTFYLICYDIVKDSRRTKVAHLLEGYGLRVQKSVFEVVLMSNSLRATKEAVEVPE
jgi:CRISPR-associated protein Cas2